MASDRNANCGRDPQRAGSLPEDLASTPQPRTVFMSADLVTLIERGRTRRRRCWPRPGRQTIAEWLEAPFWS